jgi:hypothetical protein
VPPVWIYGPGSPITRLSAGVYMATIPTTQGDGIIEWLGSARLGSARLGSGPVRRRAESVDLFLVLALPL